MKTAMVILACSLFLCPGCASRQRGDIWVEYPAYPEIGMYWPWLTTFEGELESMKGVTVSRFSSEDELTDVIHAKNAPFGEYKLVCPATIFDVPRSYSGLVFEHASRKTRVQFEGNPFLLDLTLVFPGEPAYLVSNIPHLYLFVHEYVDGIRNLAYYPRLVSINTSEDRGYLYQFRVPVQPNARYTFHIPKGVENSSDLYPMEALPFETRFDFQLEIGSTQPDPVVHVY